jgi:hypothetical protein
MAAASGANDPDTPLSWNRYSYVLGDPVNGTDRHGLFLDPQSCIENPDTCAAEDPDFPDFDQATGQGSPNQKKAARPRPIDAATDKLARGALNSRLSKFGQSHCNQVFNSVIEGYSTAGFVSTAQSTEFYNTTNPTYAGYTQNEVSSNGSSQYLGNSMPLTVAAKTIGAGGSWVSVLLGGDFFANTNSVYQQNVLLHELLHVYTNGWSDQEVFSAFQNFGLAHINPGTEDISAWLSTDCKSTPTQLQWWN